MPNRHIPLFYLSITNALRQDSPFALNGANGKLGGAIFIFRKRESKQENFSPIEDENDFLAFIRSANQAHLVFKRTLFIGFPFGSASDETIWVVFPDFLASPNLFVRFLNLFAVF